MKLLNFLLENWFFTLILLWFLFGFAGRGNREKARTGERRHPAAEQRQKQLEHTQTGQKEVKRRFSDQARRAVQELRNRVEEMEEMWHSQQDEDIFSGDRVEPGSAESPYAVENEQPYERKNPAPYKRETTVKPARASTVKAAIDSRGLRQGVIWAEVLGPPRARRPYRPPYARRD